MQAIYAQRISVQKDRLVCYVALSEQTPKMTTPQMAVRLCELVPTLPEHNCVNECGPTFGDVMGNTSIPHVLEHLIIDAQTKIAAQSNDPAMRARLFRGTTQWVNFKEGRAKIEVEYADDLVVLRALSDSLAVLNNEVLL